MKAEGRLVLLIRAHKSTPAHSYKVVSFKAVYGNFPDVVKRNEIIPLTWIRCLFSKDRIFVSLFFGNIAYCPS